jgi:urea transport system substrate-binding protein
MKRVWALVGLGVAALGVVVGWYAVQAWGVVRKPIRVGILHSLTGPMAITGKSMKDAEELALEEINAAGGLLGRRIEWVVADGHSDWPTFAQQARRLIAEEKVCVIFGCWTSASRKMVKPIIEEYNHLLIYPESYEGMEQSPNIVYLGAAPNQQITPTVMWCHDSLKARRFFLVGSDYIWPHAVNAIIHDELEALGDELLGEEYIFFGSSDVDDAVAKIQQSKPDVVLSTVVGDTNRAFYQRLREAGIGPEKTPVVSFSIAEDELREMTPSDLVGHYSALNYFQSIDRPENQEFVRRFKARYGPDRVTSDAISTSYSGVKLWAQAVSEAGSEKVQTVLKTIRNQSLDAPEGIISIDAGNQHAWRPMYIGRVRADGQFDLVWSITKPIRPVPYPITRSKSEWDAFLQDLYTRWDHNWANPRK